MKPSWWFVFSYWPSTSITITDPKLLRYEHFKGTYLHCFRVNCFTDGRLSIFPIYSIEILALLLSLLKLTTNIPYFVPSVTAPVRQTRSHFRCVQPLSRPICLQMKFPLSYLIDISKTQLGPRSTTCYTKDYSRRLKPRRLPILDFLTHIMSARRTTD